MMPRHDIKEAVRSMILAAGACRVGFARAETVGDDEMERYRSWLEAGRHGEMAYLERYDDLRRDPRTLLEGAATVISIAFDYRRGSHRHPLFADYAVGDDYHDVLRKLLDPVCTGICDRFGGTTRICIDSAPIRERYWAAKASIGIIGLNGQLIVDGIGSKVFLCEILWTGEVEPDESRTGERCLMCGRCVRACPGNALDGHGGLDARRCRSYQTIEYRGSFPDDFKLKGRIYGCDVCQDVCPLNIEPTEPAAVDVLAADERIMKLDLDAIERLDSDTFRDLFRHSAVKRTKLSGLLRNAKAAHDF